MKAVGQGQKGVDGDGSDPKDGREHPDPNPAGPQEAYAREARQGASEHEAGTATSPHGRQDGPPPTGANMQRSQDRGGQSPGEKGPGEKRSADGGDKPAEKAQKRNRINQEGGGKTTAPAPDRCTTRPMPTREQMTV